MGRLLPCITFINHELKNAKRHGGSRPFCDLSWPNMYEDNHSEAEERSLSPRQDVLYDQFASVPQCITEPVELRAQHIFLQDTIVMTPYSTGVSHGHYAKLASLLKSSLSSDALCAAVNAVALASLATRFGIPEIQPLAAAQYTSSIRHVRAQLTASASDHSKECLLASMSLLSLYEVWSLC